MKISKKQILSVLILSLISLAIFSVSLASAQTGAPTAPAGAWTGQQGMAEIGAVYGEDSQAPTSVISIIVRIINYSLGLLSVIFLGLFVFSGYQWMTAAGNEDSVEKAKSRMKNAVIGLVIVLVSWSLTYFIFYKLVLPSTTGDNTYKVRYDVDPATSGQPDVKNTNINNVVD